ncbi:MAG: glycosyltransferase family 4 protein, partial [bacterium]|nr:glycosyltransferase family 4 protein [bacterium]
GATNDREGPSVPRPRRPAGPSTTTGKGSGGPKGSSPARASLETILGTLGIAGTAVGIPWLLQQNYTLPITGPPAVILCVISTIALVIGIGFIVKFIINRSKQNDKQHQEVKQEVKKEGAKWFKNIDQTIRKIGKSTTSSSSSRILKSLLLLVMGIAAIYSFWSMNTQVMSTSVNPMVLGSISLAVIAVLSLPIWLRRVTGIFPFTRNNTHQEKSGNDKQPSHYSFKSLRRIGLISIITISLKLVLSTVFPSSALAAGVDAAVAGNTAPVNTIISALSAAAPYSYIGIAVCAIIAGYLLYRYHKFVAEFLRAFSTVLLTTLSIAVLPFFPLHYVFWRGIDGANEVFDRVWGLGPYGLFFKGKPAREETPSPEPARPEKTGGEKVGEGQPAEGKAKTTQEEMPKGPPGYYYYYVDKTSSSTSSSSSLSFVKAIAEFLKNEKPQNRISVIVKRILEILPRALKLNGKEIILVTHNEDIQGGVNVYIKRWLKYLLTNNDVVIHIVAIENGDSDVEKELRVGRGKVKIHLVKDDAFAGTLKELIATGKIEAVVTHSTWRQEALQAFKVAKESQVRCVAIYHASDSPSHFENVNDVLSLADRIGVVFKGGVDLLHREGYKNVQYVGPMPDFAFFNADEIKHRKGELRKQEDIYDLTGKIVLFAPHAIVDGKGHLEHLMALKKLKDSGKEVSVVISSGVADENYFRSLQQYCQNNGLSYRIISQKEDKEEFDLIDAGNSQDEKVDVVFIKGGLNQRALALFYLSVDIMVLPSYAEAFSLSICEAQFMGVPVVATRVGGTPEAILDGKTGILFESGNWYKDIHADRLFAALLKLINSSPEERQQMGKRAKRYIVDNHHPANLIKRHQEIILGKEREAEEAAARQVAEAAKKTEETKRQAAEAVARAKAAAEEAPATVAAPIEAPKPTRPKVTVLPDTETKPEADETKTFKEAFNKDLE